jgi:phospholipase/carboxylesterase
MLELVNMMILPAIEYETRENPDYSVIWLHGLGADGNDFAPIVPELSIPSDKGVRFIFPHAPQIPVTVNGGMVMPAWYDILEMKIDRKVDIEGLLGSVEAILALVNRELERGIKSRSIILAGFSQGGAVVYHAALSYGKPLGGILAMSTYFATSGQISYHDANHDIPIEIQHGLHDPVVPEELGREAKASLEKQGYQPTYRTYPMEHNVCPQQIKDISEWLGQVLV